MGETRILRALCAAMLVLGLAGCGEAPRGEDASEAPQSGDWVDVAGGTVTFTEDVFSTNAGGRGIRYRYRVVSENRMTLTPIVIENGVETDDTEKMRTEEFALDGDTLTMDSLWDTYYRPNSAALESALAERQKKAGTQANSSDARLQLRGCTAVTSTYSAAFGLWFDSAYPDRGSYGYSIGDYMRLRNVPIEWGFTDLKKQVAAQFASAATNYQAGIEDGAEADEFTVAGWVKAGACPSGGEYTTHWDSGRDEPLQIKCSIHGIGE